MLEMKISYKIFFKKKIFKEKLLSNRKATQIFNCLRKNTIRYYRKKITITTMRKIFLERKKTYSKKKK
jgi:hypothetical protein